MHILYYVEPLVEQERPYWKQGWLDKFVNNQIKVLKDLGNTFTIVTSEALLDDFVALDHVDLNIVSLSQSILTRKYDWDPYELSMYWYGRRPHDEGIDSYYHELFAEKLKEVSSPDIIISFSPAPFLEKLYPHAQFLHHEYGPFSRKPFVETWYFDSVGAGGFKYLENNWKNISSSLSLTSDESDALEIFCDQLTSVIDASSPFKAEVEEWGRKFDRTLLLPLQFSRSACVDGIAHHASQFSRLCEVLENLPKNVGVIVTNHPEYPLLKEEQLKYLGRRYQNLYYLEAFEEYSSSSQYLFSCVDAVVGTSWSLCAQALLWGLPTIPLRGCQYNFVSNAPDLKEIDWKNFEKNFSGDHKRLLFWILKYWAVPDFLLYDSNWIQGYLQERKAGRIPALFENPTTYFEQWKSALNEKLPVLNYRRSADYLKNQVHELKLERGKLEYHKKELSRKNDELAAWILENRRYLWGNPFWILKKIFKQLFAPKQHQLEADGESRE